VPSHAAVLASARWSFDGVLRRVRGFSRAAELESEARRPGNRNGPPALSPLGLDDAQMESPAFDALKLFVRSLNGGTQDKLRTLMQAGHEAQALPAAVASLAAEPALASDLAFDLFARGAAALQDLQRGHAIACATGFDLEAELDGWSQVREPQSLDERVWLRFGRELAQSGVEEWSCFAVVDSRERLQKLYLRRGKGRWWSFGTLIDRPADRALDVPRAAHGGSWRIVVLSLNAAIGRACPGGLPAVRRASLAVSARLGHCRVPARRRAAVAARMVTT